MPLVVLAAVGLVLASCGRGGSDSSGGGGGGGSTYKIGFIGPLSGALGTLGTNQLKAVEAAVAQKNADGGIGGKQIEVVAEDDANDPAKGIAAARSLASDGVVVIIGPPVSSIVEAVLPTTTRSDISIITIGATPEALDPAQRTLFQVDQTSSSEAQPMVEFAQELLGKDDIKVAAAPIDTPAGQAWGDNVEELAELRGFELLSTTALPVAAGDVTPQAQKAMAGDPDVILVEATDVPFVTFVQKLRDLNYDGPIVNFHGGSTKAVFDELQDPDVYAARTSVHYDPEATEPGVVNMVEGTDAADAVAGATSASLYSSAFVSGLVAMAAIEDCGDDCGAKEVTDALNVLDFDTEGLTPGRITFTEDDHQAMKEVIFWHYQDGKIVPAADGAIFVGSVYTLEAERP